MNLPHAVQRLLVSARAAVTRFVGDERAVSTVEYALIVVAIIAILGVAAGLMGDAFTQLFTSLSQEMQTGLNDVASAAGS